MSVNSLAIYGHGYHTLLHVLRILHLNVIGALTELTGDGEITEALRIQGSTDNP